MLRGGFIIASIGGLALVAWGLNKFGRDLDEAFAGAFGDLPHVPDGARVAAAHELKLGGGSELREQRPWFAQGHIAHDRGSL
jgi:hypothetical protein